MDAIQVIIEADRHRLILALSRLDDDALAHLILVGAITEAEARDARAAR